MIDWMKWKFFLIDKAEVVQWWTTKEYLCRIIHGTEDEDEIHFQTRNSNSISFMAARSEYWESIWFAFFFRRQIWRIDNSPQDDQQQY